MATPTHQRVFIIILAVVMLIGTVGSFAALILANKNQAVDSERSRAQYSEFQERYDEYQSKINNQADKLSDEYYQRLKVHEDRVGSFNAGEINDLRKEDIITGNGTEINAETPIGLYYIGWNPDGKIFDSSIADDKLKAPLFHSSSLQGSIGLEGGIGNANLIEGWKQGVTGMKIGGVRELAIPADLAYGEMGGGEDIPPNTPIKFIVMAIEPPESIAEPELPESLRGGI